MRSRLSGLAGLVLAWLVALGMIAPVAAARPFNVLLPYRFDSQPSIAQCEQQYGIACYDAAELERAYGVASLISRGITGRGTTIAVVDSFGSPTIQHDLAMFDAANNLPAPPSLEVTAPAGGIPPYSPFGADVGWAEETTLDVEMAHTIAPGASILVVETPVSETEGMTGFPQIVTAINYVVDHHMADVISQSFGATEQTFLNTAGQFDPTQIRDLGAMYDNAAAQGITVLAATGDAGATDSELNQLDYFPFPVVDFPADHPLVTAVGGLNVSLNAFGGRTAPDSVWNDPASVCSSPCAGNGGLSAAYGRPAYQASVASTVGTVRGLPDVSLSASVAGSVNTYTSFVSRFQGVPAPGWYPEAGTSEATPLMAGEVALADQIAGHPLGPINPALYAIGDGPNAGLTDITRGTNTVMFTNPSGGTYTVSGWAAGPGYDLASGLGEPNGALPAQLAAAVERGTARRDQRGGQRMTYSIVARDPATGELGIGVQSHWFAVGAVVPWARPGVERLRPNRSSRSVRAEGAQAAGGWRARDHSPRPSCCG